jgi:hypothetical protein
MILSSAPLLEQPTEIPLLEGLSLSTFKQDGYGDLYGSSHQSVIPYVHERMRVVLLCVLQAHVELD